jgi:hypothetical protein
MLDTIFINTRPSPDRFDADQMCRLLISGSDERSGTLWLTLRQIANRCTDHPASSRVSCLAAERAGSIRTNHAYVIIRSCCLRVVGEYPHEISDSRNLRDAMLIADYIAVLTLWAGAERFLRGKHLIFPNPPRDSDGSSVRISLIDSASVSAGKETTVENRSSISGIAKCDTRACRSNTLTLRAQPTHERSERNAS